jgi:hypothetical protein
VQAVSRKIRARDVVIKFFIAFTFKPFSIP